MTSRSLSALTLAIVGFGSQAKSWAANLQDGGHQTHIFLRKDSTSAQHVKTAGYPLFQLEELPSLINRFDFILLLTPDHTHKEVLDEYFRDVNAGNIILAHGYSVWKHQLDKEFQNLTFELLAPKAIASELRQNFLNKQPLFAACSNPKDQKLELLAQGLGITKLIASSFEEESVADLFSEQSLLCGLIPYTAKMSYDKLVDKGINPEIAYIECWHEVKLIADAMIQFGPKGLFELISPNALLGADLFKNQHLNEKWDTILEKCFTSIKNREFIEYESKSDISMIRAKSLEFWANSKIQETHEGLGK